MAATPGSWAHFRKIWLKPEVYPLIGSMVAALGVCGVALSNKISQPGMTFSREARKGGIHAQFEGIDEVVPMWSGSKKYSASIFDSSHEIMDNKLAPAPVVLEVEEVPEVLEVITEAPAAVEATVETVAEAVVSAVEAAVEEGTEEVAASESELLAKGAELAAELKEVSADPPAATA